jgi:hypothetical protein
MFINMHDNWRVDIYEKYDRQNEILLGNEHYP